MSTIIPLPLRAAVSDRAHGCCEYCRKPQIGFYPHEVDHAVALKHGGLTTLDNLALACFPCNRYKGSDLSSIDPQSGAIVPLFNPRTQAWDVHFRMQDFTVVPLTGEGRVTVALLHLNALERIQERIALAQTGWDPEQGG